MAKQECQHEHIWVQLIDERGEEIEHREVSRAELEAQAVELPERDAMSLVNANLAIPINLAAALNVLSDGSNAGAAAQQVSPIAQGMGGSSPITTPGLGG